MQNQNYPGFDPNNNQNGGYNDFYGSNNPNGQPQMQPVPDFNQAPNQDMGYDPNSFYNNTQGAFPIPENQGQQYPQTDPNNPAAGFSQPPLYDPNQVPDLTETATDATFEEPKSGNKFLVIGIAVLIVILLGVAGYIVYAYSGVLFGSGDSSNTSQTSSSSGSTSNSSDSSSSSSSSGSSGSTAQSSGSTNSASGSGCLVATPNRLSHTDPNETLAQKAKVYNETNFTCDWGKRSFAGIAGAVDQITGQCLKSETCGLTADSDGDGMTNIQEFNYQTDPLNPDSDSDKIADGDEINVYSTDPKKNDSDGDTYVDSQELQFCYDPNISSLLLPETDTTKGKLVISRQNEIKNKIVINPLHEPSITLWKTDEDRSALSNGFAKCAPLDNSSSSSSSSSSSGASSSNPTSPNNSTTPTSSSSQL